MELYLKGNGMIRVCLKCHKEFDSKHKGNRLCGGCNIKNMKESRMDSQVQGK